MDKKKKKNLNRIMKEKKITAKQLAVKAGLEQAAIQHYSSGYRDINKAQALTVYKIANALGCGIEDILELDEEKEEE